MEKRKFGLVEFHETVNGEIESRNLAPIVAVNEIKEGQEEDHIVCHKALLRKLYQLYRPSTFFEKKDDALRLLYATESMEELIQKMEELTQWLRVEQEFLTYMVAKDEEKV